MDELTIKRALKENTGLLSNTFKRDELLIEKAIDSAHGNKEEIFTHLLSFLNLPVNIKTIIVFNSILSDSFPKKTFMDKLFDLF
jgi:hypothetical protein